MWRIINFSILTITVLFSVVVYHSPGAWGDLRVQPHVVLRSASELDYPPFAIVNPDGSAGGFSVELLEAATKAVGLSVTFKVGPWHELKEDLLADRLDVLPLVSYSEEREKIYDFTAPYLRMYGAIFVRDDNVEIHTTSDLKNKEVIVMLGDTAHEYALREKLSDTIITTANYKDAFELLASGKHDAIVVQQLVGLQLLKQLHINNIVPVDVKTETTLKPVTLKLEGLEQLFCFAVQEGHGQLLSKLNEGLAVLHVNGTYQALYDKWFGPILPEPEITFAQIAKYLAIIIIPLSLVFAVITVWFFRRRLQNETKHLLQEINTRRLVEKQLLDSNSNFTKAQAIGKVGSWTYEAKTDQLFMSAEARRIFGLPTNAASSALTMADMERCFINKEAVHQTLRQVIDNDIPCNLEYQIRACDSGAVRTVLYMAKRGKTTAEGICVDGVVHDITERLKTREMLLKKETLLNEMGKIAKIGGWEHDLQTNAVNWTKEIYTLLELKEGYIPGPDELLTYVLPQHRTILKQAYQLARDKDEPFDLELQCTTVLGKLFSARIMGHAEFKNDQCILIRGIFQDITEKKKLEDHLQQAQKLESIGVLAGGIAHDFNNILSSIIGFTELAKESNPHNEQLQDDLSEIYTAGLRARELVQQILSFSRKTSREMKPVRAVSIVSEVLQLLRASLPAIISIERDFRADDLFVLADPTNIHQIVMNICTNAAHAMEEKGGVLSVSVLETSKDRGFFSSHPQLPKGNYLELCFADTGSGIDPEIIGQIFDPYFTTKNHGDGTGLGLSVTHGLVAEMGGVIEVASELGKGSVVSVFLPVIENTIQSTHAETELLAAKKACMARILLVDDEAPILKLISRMLTRHGFVVTTEKNGVNALQKIQSEPFAFDLVISDIGMPTLTGDALASAILEIDPDMPIILMSGYSKKISAENVSQLGVKALLQKPVMETQIIEVVCQVLADTNKNIAGRVGMENGNG